MSVSKRPFGITRNGNEVIAYTVAHEDGSYITVLDFGAILQSVVVPDKNGSLLDIVLGYDDIASYEVNPGYFGATIGRCGNRIAGASFSLNGKTYQMTANENRNNLHSGPDGFEKRMWTAEIPDEDSVRFCLASQDGDQGFPGVFVVTVTYTFTADHTVKIRYQGFTDEDTVANMTNHSYWNLNGEHAGLILSHRLQINADRYTPVLEDSIPTGEILPVEGTPFDFRKMKTIGQDAAVECVQLARTSGYDHNFVLNDQHAGMRTAALAEGDVSGIRMEVTTDQPGMQFYAGNFISQEPKGKGAISYPVHAAFALETQHYPDSVNQPAFESPILRVNEKYDTSTWYHFSA